MGILVHNMSPRGTLLFCVFACVLAFASADYCDLNKSEDQAQQILCDQALRTCQTALRACNGNRICDTAALTTYNTLILGVANQVGGCKCQVKACDLQSSGEPRQLATVALVLFSLVINF